MRWLLRSSAVLLLLPFVFFYVATVFAASEGPLYSGTQANDATVGTVSWNSTGFADADDSSPASCALAGSAGQDGNYLKVTNFGFSIPSGATINGIVVEVEAAAVNSNMDDNSVRMVKGGTISGDDKANGTNWGTFPTYSVKTYGTSTDLWGLTWSDSDINASDFGFVYSPNKEIGGGAANFFLDYIRITVHYTAGGGGGAVQTNQVKMFQIY